MVILSVTAQSPALLVVARPRGVWNLSGSGVHQLSQRRIVGDKARVRVGNSCSPIDEPILRDALKEPVAFLGGMFAGLLRLDLNEEPLKEWVTRAVEASGITEDDIDAQGSRADEEAPEQIVIE